MASSSQEPEIQVEVDRTGQSARISIPATIDPACVETSLLAELARGKGIKVDVAVSRKLDEIAESFCANPRDVDEEIAQGTPATDGEDGRIEWMSGFDPAGNVPAVADVVGQVSYYDRVSYIRVAEGDHVATIHPPTNGTDGADVTGRVVKAKPGRPCKVNVDTSSFTVGPDGRVVGTRGGLLRLENDNLRIEDLFRVDGAVDFSTGNVALEGSVHIKEGVCDRFVVNATGDVVVDGLVEAATIRCGRNFSCRRGMAAKGRGCLIVEQDADVGFLNDVRGYVRQNLVVRRELINCNLVIGGDLDIDRGAIIGGIIRVTGEIRASVVGSDAEIPTVLVLGTVPLLAARRRKVAEAAELHRAEIERLEKQWLTLPNKLKRMMPSQKKALAELERQLDEVRAKLEECEAERTHLLAEIERLGTVNVWISKMIHPKVRLRSTGFDVLFIKPVEGPVKVIWDDDRRLRIQHGDGAPRNLEGLARIVKRAA